MTSLKPITTYGKAGPNPPKIIMLLEELGLPYEAKNTQFSELKSPEFLAINPNGRMPAIQDPNTGLTLWESGAIAEYLVEKYDTEHKISFEQGSAESHLARQWLFFQVSGQGPYYGQAAWFTKYHPEQIESAKQRYYAEIKRVTSVLEDHLAKQPKGADGPWLVGGKFSYADLVFVPWQQMAVEFFDGVLDLSEFKLVRDWIDRLLARPSIGPVMQATFQLHK